MEFATEESKNPAVAKSDPRIVIFLQPYRSVRADATGPDRSGTAWNRLTIPAVTALLSPNSFWK